MIYFKNGVKLVQSESELPNLVGASDIFMDTETSSGRHDTPSYNPWRHCSPCGIGITVDDIKGSWYIPVGHHNGDDLLDSNLSWSHVANWLQDILNNAKRWINHNVKYDALVLDISMLDIPDSLELVDTVTLSKIIDSDRGYGRGTYEMKSLSRDWLNEDIDKYEERLQPYLKGNKDYGSIPPDILGEYGGQDVLTGRRLWKYIDAKCPDQCRSVWNTEIEVTRVLFEMEKYGFAVNPIELATGDFLLNEAILKNSNKLKDLVGYPVRSWANDDCYDVLCNSYGLPVISWNDSGNPSFDKDALKQYLHHPDAPTEIVELMLETRQMNTMNDLFVANWRTKHVDGVMHPMFNQCIRTGRMSCKDPNAQQFSKYAKMFVRPRPGMSFIDVDYSQIEFRLIVHYIQDAAAISAYGANPDTDFHTWVAEMCGIPRSPAKNVNFCIGYGGGKRRVLSMLSGSMDLMGVIKETIKGKVDNEEEMFKMLCEKRANDVFKRYHDTLPNLRRTTKRAATALRQKGYVYNGAGRHRHLPLDFAHKAFNSLCQSFAADIMKERLVAIWKKTKTDLTHLNMACTVHDSILLECPTEMVEESRQPVLDVLENPPFDLRVPLRADWSVSDKSWAHCDPEFEQLPAVAMLA